MTISSDAPARPRAPGADFGRDLGSHLRILIVGGLPYGVLVAGAASRLAMLLLRLTSPDAVSGVTSGIESDDGFTIGQTTLGGTYNLLLLGATVGIIGAAAYRVVAPRLIGPRWFRCLTTGLAAAAVAGGMLIHADGIDFRALKPTWLALGIFVLLPGVFGTFIGPVVDRVASEDSWTAKGRTRWVLPLALVACFPTSLMIVLVATLVLTVWLLVRSIQVVDVVRRSTVFGLLIRGAWLTVAALGLLALVDDINAVLSVT
jgi:hypothetical protein